MALTTLLSLISKQMLTEETMLSNEMNNGGKLVLHLLGASKRPARLTTRRGPVGFRYSY
jgi:hypothetical protein